MIFHDPDRPDADWTEEAETLPMRRRLLSFRAVEALLDAAFPQARRPRPERAHRPEMPTIVRPDLTVSAALSKLNHVFTTTPPMSQPTRADESAVREKPPDKSGVVRAVSKKNATWIAWVVRIPATVALGILLGTVIAIFIYGGDVLLSDVEPTVTMPIVPIAPAPIASALTTPVAPLPVGPPPPPPVVTSPAAEVPPPVQTIKPVPTPAKPKVEKPKKAPVTADTRADKRVTTPPPKPAPSSSTAVTSDSAPSTDDKAMKREKALAEAARKLAERQLSQSLSR